MTSDRTDPHASLRPDCADCFGLCCVALSFAASADFAFDKDPGEPCTHLRPDYGCGIHARLRTSGFKGCSVFDCFGAGQRVAQGTYGGRDWRSTPDVAEEMFAVFHLLRQLHELLWHLTHASDRAASPALAAELAAARAQTELVAAGSPDEILTFDVASHRRGVQDLLSRTSQEARAVAVRPGRRRSLPERVGPRADLVGAPLRGADLTGADMRGA